MFWRSELHQMGSRVLAGGLIVAAVTLSVMLVDQVVTGGTQSIMATCVLFLWACGSAVVIGIILRMVGAHSRRGGPMPGPPLRRRSGRSRGEH
ncbi:MAG: hypothetical protein WEE53_01435 [Acidimicrobiia bacterium]